MNQGLLSGVVEAMGEGDILAGLRANVIGRDAEIVGPVGALPMLYADYAASGRALWRVERFIQEAILPYYANAHTEASYCGAFINRARAEARAAVASICNAGDECAVIFAGSGATAGVNKLVDLLGARWPPRLSDKRKRPLILIGPYEHHSNLLPWRESGSEVVEIPEASCGGPNTDIIENILRDAEPGRLIIGAFSAASNVTGIVADVQAITRQLKSRGALAMWDYAAAAPYLPIDMGVGGGIDAVAFSPHKFVGGPGASGVLIVRKSVVTAQQPTQPGGGTVSFVSPWAHHYAADLVWREEAGTPNVVGDIRAALVLMIKASIGDRRIAARDAELSQRAIASWRENKYLEILGPPEAQRVPIFSFRVRDGCGSYVHHQLVTRILSDYFGVQARGGCACAGPYAHRLLGLERDASQALWERLQAGHELEKPGWTRVNFSYLFDEEETERLIDAVDDVAFCAPELAENYECDLATARFRHKGSSQ